MPNRLLIVVVLSLFIQAVAQENIIKVGYKFYTPRYDSFLENIIELTKEGDLGVQVGEFINPDILLVDDVRSDLIDSIPLILMPCCWNDSASIFPQQLPHLNNPQVKAYFGNFIFRDRELYEKKTKYGFYHFGLIDSNYGMNSDKFSILSPEALEKIKCVPWTFRRNILGRSALKKLLINFDAPRPIDVYFRGHDGKGLIEKGAPAYRAHRQKALAVLRSIKSVRKKVSTSFIPFQEYISELRKSKIVVSPWGFGEWCWRDYEAILAGAILIKPDSSFVKTIPDIYKKNKYYIPCKPDFSDLKEIIDHILKNYPQYKSMRKEARQLLVSYSKEEFLQTFVDHIKAVYAQNSDE